jgi:hypothetical protein
VEVAHGGGGLVALDGGAASWGGGGERRRRQRRRSAAGWSRSGVPMPVAGGWWSGRLPLSKCEHEPDDFFYLHKDDIKNHNLQN